MILKWIKAGFPPKKCKGGKHYVVIDPFGNVYPCFEMENKLEDIKKLRKINNWKVLNNKCQASNYLGCHVWDNLIHRFYDYLYWKTSYEIRKI